MMDNTLFQSLDRDTKLTEKAQLIIGTLDVLTSAIVGRLIAERCLDFAGQPGQAIEYASLVVAEVLTETLHTIDQVELRRLCEHVRAESKK